MPQNYKNITRNTTKRTKKAPKQTNSYFLTAAGTIGCLVKIAMQQYGCGTLLSACRTAIDCHIISIHIRILLGSSLDPEVTVWESGILQILVANLLKLLAAIGSSHRIELDNDETEFGKRSGVPVIWHETLRSIGIARTRIDILDNRIFLVRIEIGRALDDAPHIGLAITPLSHKYLRSYPSVLLQRRDRDDSSCRARSSRAVACHP